MGRKKQEVVNWIWDEERIREEMRRLDKKLEKEYELNGADLTIEFYNGKATLGKYMMTAERKPKGFKFSNYYFQNPEFTEAEALDVIRHEYAHYMDHMIHGRVGHGAGWKKCCLIVGAKPERYYNVSWANYKREEQKEIEELEERCQAFKEKMVIEHPRYGNGEIQAMENEGMRRILIIEFPSIGLKRIAAGWVVYHCKYEGCIDRTEE